MIVSDDRSKATPKSTFAAPIFNLTLCVLQEFDLLSILFKIAKNSFEQNKPFILQLKRFDSTSQLNLFCLQPLEHLVLVCDFNVDLRHLVISTGCVEV